MRGSALSDRQEQIIAAAIRLLATKGARRFTVQLLATEIGVTGGAIYRHFASMEAVVDAVVAKVGRILFEGFPPQAPDPIERLEKFFFHRVDTLLTYPFVSRLLHSDHLAQSAGPAQAARMEGYKRRSREFVLDCLREAEQAGTLAQGTSADAGAVIVLGSILSLAHASTKVVSDAQASQLGEQVWTTIERALRSREPMRSAQQQPRRRRQDPDSAANRRA